MTADALFELGVPITDGDAEPLAYAECVRIARRLRTPGYSPIGFLPASDAVATAPVAIQLVSAMVDVSAQDAAYVDGLARIPTRAWSSRARDRRSSALTRWVRPSLAVVTPSPVRGARERALAAREAIEGAAASFRHVAVDLTGFDRLGETASAIASMSRVVVVASRLATTEAELLAVVSEVPAPKRLGVVLVG